MNEGRLPLALLMPKLRLRRPRYTGSFTFLRGRSAHRACGMPAKNPALRTAGATEGRWVGLRPTPPQKS